MRIIAGTKKRIPLLPPRDNTTRPITDRVKESLFSILQPQIPEKYVLDLFCGTGSLGLEALSRGSCHALMVENDKDSAQRLRKNIAKLNFQECTTVIQTDAFKFVTRPLSTNYDTQGDNSHQEFIGLAFVDPPYALARMTSDETKLGRLLIDLSRHLIHRAVAVVRHERRVELSSCYGNLNISDRREYGGMALTFLENIIT
ncbi:MAG: 16S rRNA (guanine(966)-N(2))-methyltransferase RsmD [Planctomycetes bacterium]|nr:16S rRNA (guanine(966)-N(2))-methyltransferase RsmD [Planctomycetota bacterium]